MMFQLGELKLTLEEILILKQSKINFHKTRNGDSVAVIKNEVYFLTREQYYENGDKKYRDLYKPIEIEKLANKGHLKLNEIRKL